MKNERDELQRKANSLILSTDDYILSIQKTLSLLIEEVTKIKTTICPDKKKDDQDQRS